MLPPKYFFSINIILCALAMLIHIRVSSWRVVVELNEILLQEWRERRYASIKQPRIIQANMFGKLEIISATDVLKDDSFTNESGYVLLTFLLLNRKREHPLRLLTDVIWESTDMENPYNSIKNVVYRLRSTLACIGIRDLIH